MRITRLGARNFRTLENFELDFQSNYCTISGKNNAGKSALVKIIQHFFNENTDGPVYFDREKSVSFVRDKTQWSTADQMEIFICVELDRSNDSEIFFVVETYSKNKKIDSDTTIVELCHLFKEGEDVRSTCKVDGIDSDERDAIEVIKKFKSTTNLIVHNSTNPSRKFFYMDDDYMELLESHFSQEDRKKISDATKNLQLRIKQAAKQHKEELGKLLGRLNEKYQAELTTVGDGVSARFPLQIKLTDKTVAVPLTDWGSGTQNRTRVLMSVLDVVRIRSSATASDRTTPVFIVEEPESFLHPSAQVEFGQVLNGLANELKIQIIATTHSPYLLNQIDPVGNILLDRKQYRQSLRETQIVPTDGNDWMLPFSEKLGVIPSEFESWKNVVNSQSGKVVLVEGDLDKRYFEIIKGRYSKIYKIPQDVEIVAYGGKDALKNTSVLQFMISKFKKVVVTFDLDAEGEVKQNLERIGLKSGIDFCSIGIAGAGTDCIEGLLPASVNQKVYAARYDLVNALSSHDTKARNAAKSALKVALLDEFQKFNFDDKELSGFSKLFAGIAKMYN